MIIVDSSVWVDFFNHHETAEVALLRNLLLDDEVGLGDVVLFEVLQGFRTDGKAQRTMAFLSGCQFVWMVNPVLAQVAAGNYRYLRQRGITIRSSIDCLIATAVIAGNHTLLHNDRDFDHFEEYLGLRVLHP